MDLPDGIDDIIIDSLGIFWADTDLNEAVKNIERLPAAIGSVHDLFALRAVKGRPMRMARPLVDHGFCDGQQN